MKDAPISLTVMLCGSAVLMVSGTLTRLDVEEALEARSWLTAPAEAAADQGQDGELEGEAPSLSGDLLVAVPGLDDPYFADTVIYLLAHDESGALGVVLNQPRVVSDDRYTVYEGGPVALGRVLALHDQPNRGAEIEPGVYVAAEGGIVQEILQGQARGRVFIGYAGWGPGQLERELAEGAWRVAPGGATDLFGAPNGHADCPFAD